MSEGDEADAAHGAFADFLREERETVRPLDPELMRLVDLMNALDTAEIGVTLHVSGAVVSGMLISMTQYYRLLIDQMTDASKLTAQSDFEAAGSFANAFFRPTLEAAEKDLQEHKESQTPVVASRHLHFRYAQTYLNNLGQPLLQGLWRCRLTAVDAWSVGNFGSIPPLQPR